MLDRLPDDLLAHVLVGNVGIWTYANLRQASRSLLRLLQDEELLRAAVAYVGGVTQHQLCHLLRLTRNRIKDEAPLRRTRVCVVYAPDAVVDLLRKHGGFDELRRRRVLPYRWDVPLLDGYAHRARGERERRLHRRELSRRFFATPFR